MILFLNVTALLAVWYLVGLALYEFTTWLIGPPRDHDRVELVFHRIGYMSFWPIIAFGLVVCAVQTVRRWVYRR